MPGKPTSLSPRLSVGKMLKVDNHHKEAESVCSVLSAPRQTPRTSHVTSPWQCTGINHRQKPRCMLGVCTYLEMSQWYSVKHRASHPVYQLTLQMYKSTCEGQTLGPHTPTIGEACKVCTPDISYLCLLVYTISIVNT